jgi:deoxyadenosine/deoxycytidine kinase
MTYIAIEGVIGCGKSTLASHMARRLGWQMLPEPVDGNELLPLFYQDPKRWAFALQVAMLHSRFRSQQVAGYSHVPCVMDRSLPGDRVFAALHVKYGNISPVEWRVYEQCYRAMTSVQPPSLLVFLDVDPEVALARVQKRARTMETGVTIDYLRDLAAGYNDLIDEIEAGGHAWSRGIKVVRYPWNGDITDWDNAYDVNRVIDMARSAVHGQPD